MYQLHLRLHSRHCQFLALSPCHSLKWTRRYTPATRFQRINCRLLSKSVLGSASIEPISSGLSIVLEGKVVISPYGTGVNVLEESQGGFEDGEQEV